MKRFGIKRLTILFGAIIFLFVISTTTWAAPPAKDVNCDLPCINSYEIEDGAVGSADITDGTVDTADIADGAITDAKVTGPISRTNLETASNVVVVAQSGGDFATITAALAGITPSAANPYVIEVMPGTYTENVTMKSYVHLRGAGREVTTLSATSTSNTAITIDTLVDVSVSGLTVTGGRKGILLVDSSPTIRDNNISENQTYGMYNTNSSPRITGNIFFDNGEGIENIGGEPFIEGNIFESNNWVGIWNDSSAAFITGNAFIANGSGSYGDGGICNDNATTAVVSDNTFINNSDGIADYTSTSTTIVGNTITGSGRYGIDMNGDTAVIINNRITGSGTADIEVYSHTPNVTSNVFDTFGGTITGAYNVKSDGTPW